MLAACGFAGTWDVALNFNAPNNPNASTVFSYGQGTTPALFTLLGNATPNCVGTPTYCLDNGLGFPSASAVTWNGTAGNANYATIVQPNTEVRMDPQNSPGTILRFTAPSTDIYSVTGFWDAIDTQHGSHHTTGDIYVNGVDLFPNVDIGAFGTTNPFALTNLALTAGQTIDFIVTTRSDASFLSTGLDATITGSVPEPATLSLIGFGLLAVARLRRRR
jgi:hypothetical protein